MAQTETLHEGFTKKRGKQLDAFIVWLLCIQLYQTIIFEAVFESSWHMFRHFNRDRSTLNEYDMTIIDANHSILIIIIPFALRP